MRSWKSLVSWLFLLGGVFLLLEGSSSVYPFLAIQSAPHRPSEVELVNDLPVEIATSSYAFDLTLPRFNTTVSVVEGTTDAALKRGPGHLEGTPWPWATGNAVIAGHRDTHFRVLKNIRTGDEIWVQRGNHRFMYEVTDARIVKPEDTRLIQPTPDTVLTLVTCYPFYYIGPAPERFVVRAVAMSR